MTEKKRPRVKRRAVRTYLPKSEEAALRQVEGRRAGWAKSLEIRRAKAVARLKRQLVPVEITMPPSLPGRFEKMSLLDFAALWILDNNAPLAAVLEPFQHRFLSQLGAIDAAGIPKWRRVVCSWPRQSGKSELASCYAAWRLLKYGGTVVSTAQDQEQSYHLRGRLCRVLRRCSRIAEAFRLEGLRGNRIELASGEGVWVFLSSDMPSSGGFVVGTTVVDEVGWFGLNSWQFIGQIEPSPSVPWSQSLYLGYKGNLGFRVAGCPLFDLMRAAERGDPDLYADIREGRSEASWHSDSFLEEKARTLPRSVYSQLYLNAWTQSESGLFTIEQVDGIIDRTLQDDAEATVDEICVMGVDLGLTSDRSVVSVCGIDPATQSARLLKQVVWAGDRDNPVSVQEVEDTVTALYWRYGCAVIFLDPWQGVHLAQKLITQGVRCELFSFTGASVEQLASTLYQLVSTGRLRLPDNPQLRSELLTIEAKRTATGFRWQHPAGTHDDRCTSLALSLLPLAVDPDSVRPPVKTQVRFLDEGPGFDFDGHKDFAEWL